MASARLALHWKILLGLVLGLAAGAIVNLTGDMIVEAVGPDGLDRAVVDFVTRLNGFIGEVFLRALRFIAVPIVLFSLVYGTSRLDDLRKLTRVGGKTIGIYLGTTAVAITVGLGFANLVRPGRAIPSDVRRQLAGPGGETAAQKIESAQPPDMWDTLLRIVPVNPFASLAEGKMLQVVFLALVVGVGLSVIPRDKAQPIVRACGAMTDVMIRVVHAVMRIAPIAVFALLAGVVAELGFDVLAALLHYSVTVVAGLAIMMFLVYPLVLRLATRIGYGTFFRGIAPAQLLAFSSSSSSATLPVTMDCAEHRLGVSGDVASLALPLGATLNMDGTALYQGVAAVFIAQLYGMDMGLSEQTTIVLTATLASIGTAGVPGVGLVMLVIVLQSIGLSPTRMEEGLAIIFGVDRLLDMCRTSCNVTGDCMVAAVVASSEQELHGPAEPGAEAR